MRFSDDIERFTRKAEKKALNIFRAVGLSMFGKIVKRTPVGNPSLWMSKAPKGYTGGSLRNAWQITPKVILGGKILITNNLPYAKPVEDGHSTQAPNGMVKVTVAEFDSTVRKFVRVFK